LSVPPGILSGMNHEFICQGTRVERQRADGELRSWETSNIQHPTPNIEVGEAERLAFDNVKASQARADLIAFTKTFFGLDSECPSQPGNLSA